MRRAIAVFSVSLSLILITVLTAQVPTQRPTPTPTPSPPPLLFPPEPVRPIAPPATPLPPENQSSGANRFSFVVYGDTRGRRDGVALQHEHWLVVDAMLAQIQQLKTTPFPVRFVLQ